MSAVAEGVHPPVTPEANRVRVRAASLSLLVGLLLLAVKYFAYLVTGSAAILSDALEGITNVVGASFALGGILFAIRPADEGHPYGHGKIEYMSAVFEGGLIAFAAVLVVWFAVRDLLLGAEVARVDLGLLLTVGAGLANLALGDGWKAVLKDVGLDAVLLHAQQHGHGVVPPAEATVRGHQAII